MTLLSWFYHNLFQPMFWFQPVFYSFHGWLATEMALWMLFHPYEPKFIPGTRLQLPFTPGIFPRGRHKLSVSIANTITEILLTQEDIKKQAEKLITEDNILKTIDALFDSIGAELRDINHIQRIYRYVENLLPPLLQKLLNDYIVNLEQGEDKHFDNLFNQLFNRIAPHIALNPTQAAFIADTAFHLVITPANTRHLLIDLLTSDNIATVEDTIRSRVKGLQGLLIRFVDIPKGLFQFRQFLIDEPTEADSLIGDFIDRLALKEKLTRKLLTFSVQQLPVETLEEIKSQLNRAVKNLLITHRQELVGVVCNLSEEAAQSLTSSLMHVDYQKLSAWLPGFKKDLARFSYTYLHNQLENMVSKALPAISLNTVIVEKIDQFSARQLEETIQRICHRELRWLAFLGAFLGFWLGLVSNLVNYWWHPSAS